MERKKKKKGKKSSLSLSLSYVERVKGVRWLLRECVEFLSFERGGRRKGWQVCGDGERKRKGTFVTETVRFAREEG